MAQEAASRTRKKFSQELFQRVIARIEAGSFTLDAIKSEGIHHSTFYENLTTANSATLKQAQLSGPVHKAELALYERGVEGVDEPVYQGGKMVGTVRKYSDTALIFYLKGNHPERYSDSPTVKVLNQNVTVSPENLKALKDAQEENNRLLSDVIKRRQLALQPTTVQESESDQLWRAK